MISLFVIKIKKTVIFKGNYNVMIARGQLNIEYLCINIAELLSLYKKSYLILLNRTT